jgi:hypothetical protein
MAVWIRPRERISRDVGSLDTPQGVGATQLVPERADDYGRRCRFVGNRPPGHPPAGTKQGRVAGCQAEAVDDVFSESAIKGRQFGLGHVGYPYLILQGQPTPQALDDIPDPRRVLNVGLTRFREV